MRPDRGDAALLWDMLANAREVVGFTRGIDLESYLHDTMRRRAVERTVQIIGEAASKVSRAFRDSTPTVPWIPIIKQRHILVHEYGEIDHEKIHRVATIHVPKLIELLEPLMPAEPPNPCPEPEDH
jgi:uncharacterized protein with HEPN domain